MIPCCGVRARRMRPPATARPGGCSAAGSTCPSRRARAGAGCTPGPGAACTAPGAAGGAVRIALKAAAIAAGGCHHSQRTIAALRPEVKRLGVDPCIGAALATELDGYKNYFGVDDDVEVATCERFAVAARCVLARAAAMMGVAAADIEELLPSQATAARKTPRAERYRGFRPRARGGNGRGARGSSLGPEASDEEVEHAVSGQFPRTTVPIGRVNDSGGLRPES